jgi:hypothetical protein
MHALRRTRFTMAAVNNGDDCSVTSELIQSRTRTKTRIERRSLKTESKPRTTHWTEGLDHPALTCVEFTPRPSVNAIVLPFINTKQSSSTHCVAKRSIQMVNHPNLLGGLDLLCFVWSDMAVTTVRDIAVCFLHFFSRLANQATW